MHIMPYEYMEVPCAEMINNPRASQEKLVFKADLSIVEHLKKHKSSAYEICCCHVGRYVSVQTAHGHTYEGEIAHVDHHHLYLKVVAGGDYRSPLYPPYGPYYPYNPYSQTILPLVLYELLVISLLH